MSTFARTSAWLVGTIAVTASSAALAFSQNALKGGGSPPGHDYITLKAGLEVLGESRPQANGSNRPAAVRARRANPFEADAKGEVKRLVDRIKKAARRSDPNFGYGRFDELISTNYGQRWVDLGGTTPYNSCFFGAVQNPDELQHDHFLRAFGEKGLEGGRRAINASVARFKALFVAAAIASGPRITFNDGGIAVTKKLTADRNFFLFGRAVHLLQDSFSPEHVTRTKDLRRIAGIKSFVCTLEAEQHTKNVPVTVKYSDWDYPDEDVIWTKGKVPGPGALATANELDLKPAAIAAIEATKDLYAAFLRTMAVGAPGSAARKAKAEEQAQIVIDEWLAIDADEMALRHRLTASDTALWTRHNPSQEEDTPMYIPNDAVQLKCLGKKGMASLGEVVVVQRNCLVTAAGSKAGPEFDPVLRLPYVYDLTSPRSAKPGEQPRAVSDSKANPDPAALAARYSGTVARRAGGTTHTLREVPVTPDKPKVKLVAPTRVYDAPKQTSDYRELFKGDAVEVLADKREKQRNGTYRWCKIRVSDLEQWLPCAALPPANRR